MRKMSFASCSVSAAVGSSMTRMRARAGERAGDLDDALLGDREPLHLRCRRRSSRSRAGREARAARSRIVASSTTRKAGPALHRQVGERDVLGDGHVGHDRDFLRQQADAGGDGRARIGEDDLLAVDLHGAGVAACRRRSGSSPASTCRRRSSRAAPSPRPAATTSSTSVEHGDAAERLADPAHLEARDRSWMSDGTAQPSALPQRDRAAMAERRLRPPASSSFASGSGRRESAISGDSRISARCFDERLLREVQLHALRRRRRRSPGSTRRRCPCRP